jgi:predicted DNA-binding protein
MAISVDLDAALEARLEQEAQRLGMTKSAFVRDVIERALGVKNPAELLKAVRSNIPMGNPDASENVSEQVKAKLRALHSS